MKEKRTSVALIGNPNCGKTTLFNTLTGSKQQVGNWPGVTVDKKTGICRIEDKSIEVIDLPGTYSFESSNESLSQDEQVVREFLRDEKDSVLINIVDASNLQRHLYLTFQLIDLQRPMIVVLNMMDVAKLNGIKIDIPELEKELGCPVISINAKKSKGINKLQRILATNDFQTAQSNKATLSQSVYDIVNAAITNFPADSSFLKLNPWEQREILFGSDHYFDNLSPTEQANIEYYRKILGELAGGELDIVLASSRYEAIDNLAKKVISTSGVASHQLTNQLDKLALGRITGIPLFLIAMFFLFMIAINLGSSFIDFFDILAGAIFVDGLDALLTSIDAPSWINAILAKGIGAGIQTVASFIPVVGMMFLCLSFLEDSGYLARAAIVVDRGMRAIGLPGKAFVPMLVGFGCNIPAIMGTRTLESHRDRLMSIMMIPFMSCGARLPVYALFVAIFFPTNSGVIVYGLYLLGIAVAIFTGFLLKKSLLKGPITPFIMELPPYHLPTLKGLLLRTWDRLKAFLYKAGRAIIIVVSLLGILNTWGTDGSFGNEDSAKSVLSEIGRTITPVFEPMGITEENWPATVAVFTGIFAKESVIGTLNSLYAQMEDGAEDEEEEFNFWDATEEAFLSISENLKALPGKFLDPLGISSEVAEGDLTIVKENQDVDDSAVLHISSLFSSSASVFAYLIFVLLYTPCVAALGAIYREAGIKWTIVVTLWTFIIGWMLAVAFYQASLLGGVQHQNAIYWLAGLTIGMGIIFIGLRLVSRYEITASSEAIIAKSHNKNKKGGCC